jgi:hypothetical protein
MCRHCHPYRLPKSLTGCGDGVVTGYPAGTGAGRPGPSRQNPPPPSQLNTLALWQLTVYSTYFYFSSRGTIVPVFNYHYRQSTMISTTAPP